MHTVALVAPRTRLTPLALWHLLSLDAPTVATLWTLFTARSAHTSIPPCLPPAMFLAVWLLYAADRLLDAHPLSVTTAPQVPAQSRRDDPAVALSRLLQPRHRFHSVHRLPFVLTIFLATLGLAILVPNLPVALLRPYLVLAATFGAWFALIHLTPLPLPKEFAPGLFFAAAVFIPIPQSLLPAILFAALCTLNCLYIHAWEHPPSRVPHPHDSLIGVRAGLDRRPAAPAHLQAPQDSHRFTRLTLPHLPQLTLALALLPLVHPTPVSIATSLSALSLFALNYYRDDLSPTSLRAAADLALLTPVLILPFLP